MAITDDHYPLAPTVTTCRSRHLYTEAHSYSDFPYLILRRMAFTPCSSTYDHRRLRTRDPVRSPIDKQAIARLVLGWVTTGESLVLYVIYFFLISETVMTVVSGLRPGYIALLLAWQSGRRQTIVTCPGILRKGVGPKVVLYILKTEKNSSMNQHWLSSRGYRSLNGEVILLGCTYTKYTRTLEVHSSVDTCLSTEAGGVNRTV